jgi:hypothetical protein
VGVFQFNRKDYPQSKVAEPWPRAGFSWPLLLLAAVIMVVGGFVVYRLLGRGAIGEPPSDNADVAKIEQRLHAIEHRLDQVERRREPFTPGPPAAAPKREPTSATSHPSSPPVVRTIYRISPPPEPRSSIASPPPKSSPDGNQLSQQQQKELDSLRGDVVSTRQEWEATTDRLGNVAGELVSQREEMTRHRESLEQLAAHFQYSSVPFTLQKGAKAQRVGPVSLRLQSTDNKNQRYTLRLVLNDKGIELKNRALNEAIQFYDSGGKVLLELAVSEIGKEAVSGRLALPQTTASR